MSIFLHILSQLIPGEDAALEAAGKRLKRVAYRKNDLILEAGIICKKVVCVNKGMCYMYKTRGEKEEVVEFYIEKMLCSDYISFIKQAPAANSIRALEDCELEEMSHEDLHHLYNTYDPIERVGRIITENLYCGIVRRMLSYQNDSPELRYQKLLKDRPWAFQRAPQYLIASFLGLTPVGLSKIRKRLHDHAAPNL